MGSGCAMYIARQIVEAHGGMVTAHARPGGGATFRVELLPLEPVPLDEDQP